MSREPGTHELGLFTATAKRGQPRAQRGRFVRVRYSAQRLKVLAVARQMRADMGLPPCPWLSPFGAPFGADQEPSE